MKRIFPTIALTLCASACSNNEVKWEEPVNSTPEQVPGGASTFNAPQYVDMHALEAERQRNAAHSFPSAQSLANTVWEMEQPPVGEPKKLEFLAKMLVTTTAEGQRDTLLADYSASQPGCIGNPMCIVTLNRSNTTALNFPYTEGDKLWFTQCVDWKEGEVPSDEEFRTKHNAVAVFRSGHIVCTAGVDQAPYTLRLAANVAAAPTTVIPTPPPAPPL